MTNVGPFFLTRRASLQRGLSLMELMIGITIGLLVVVAALGSLSFTQVTATSVGDSARLQQKANNAFRSIGFQTRQAGAIEFTTSAGTGMLQFSSTFDGFGGTGGIAAPLAVTGVDGGGGATDRLRVSYQDNGVTRDCQGNLPVATAGVRVDNEFYVGTGVNAGKLMCRGANDFSPLVDGQAIIDGVEDFQVMYNARSVTTRAISAKLAAASGAASAPRVPDVASYQQYGAASAPFNPALVPVGEVPIGWSVTVCLQLRGDFVTDAPRGGSIAGCSGPVAADGRIRRVFRNTYGLRATLL